MNHNKKHNPVQYKKRIAKWLFRLLTVIGICVLYYFVFSFFFDTPLEYAIKKSNQKLEEQYAILKQRYDSIHNTLDNVIDRDREIHKILFEAEPYSSWDDKNQESTQRKDEILEKSNIELGDELIERTGILYQRVYAIAAAMKATKLYTLENRNDINKIPAIQPVNNPDFTALTASFGERIHPFYKSMKMHNGIDFSVPTGTAVFATADGYVTEIQSRGQTTGVSIKIRHGNSYETYYANLSRTVAQVGRAVNRGDVIAFSGDSGMSFAPHLHYEVRHKGKPVDPINYFFLEVDIHNQERLRKIAATGMQSFD